MIAAHLDAQPHLLGYPARGFNRLAQALLNRDGAAYRPLSQRPFVTIEVNLTR